MKKYLLTGILLCLAEIILVQLTFTVKLIDGLQE